MKKTSKNDDLARSIDGFRLSVDRLVSILGLVFGLGEGVTVPARRRRLRKRVPANNILKNPAARELFREFFKTDFTYSEMTFQLNKIPNFSTSRSAVARLWSAVVNGEIEL